LDFIQPHSKPCAIGCWRDRWLAIVIDGRIHMAPVLQTALPGEGQISGPQPLGFTTLEQRALVSILKTKPLPCRLVLEAEEAGDPF